MIREFALDPEAFSKLEDTRYLRAELQLHRGRVISDFPTKWQFILSKQIAKLPPVKRKRMMQWLEKIQTYSACQRDFDDSRTWLDNAKLNQAHQGRAFHAILSCEETFSCEDDVDVTVLNAIDVDEEDDLWQVPTQKVIPRTHAAIARSCEFLVLHANKILLVEPYFDPGDDSKRKSIARILATLNQRSGCKPVIEIHTYQHGRGFNPRFDHCVQLDVPDCVPSGFQAEVFLWDAVIDGERFHRRYVLTDIGGMFFEGGLDAGRTGQTTDVGLLEPEMNKKRRQDYHPQYSTFKLVSRSIVEGTGRPT